ncbi:hypothetical protein FRC12_015921 [Ceratobasidium sp. 428]|nr:hypothetical protein FRC12_015921 [Ceratobasidium sp. 428]
MPPKPSKRERPNAFPDRPSHQVVRSRPTTPQPTSVNTSGAYASGDFTAIFTSGPSSTNYLQLPQIDRESIFPVPEIRATTPTTTRMAQLIQERGARANAMNRENLVQDTGTSSLPVTSHPETQRSNTTLDQTSVRLNQTQCLTELGHRTLSPAGPTPTYNKTTGSVNLKNALRRLGKVAGVLPPLNSAVEVLVDCVGALSLNAKSHPEYDALAANIASSIEILEVRLSQPSPTELAASVTEIVHISALKRQADHINAKQSRTQARILVDGERDHDEIMGCYRELDALFRRLQTEALFRIETHAAIGNERSMEIYLEKLNPVMMASYDSSIASQLGRGGCTLNTRQMILEGLQNWANDPHGSKVYWMNGMAGTGKTTIAYSFCSRLEKSCQLAASFFCSRSLSECQDVSRITPTIMYYLALLCPPVKEVLSRMLRNDPTIGTRGVMTQIERLMSWPLREVETLISTGQFVIVIDALDECSGHDDARLFLRSLLRFASDLPIKFFVTCRPDSTLLSQLSSAGSVSHSLLHLHDIERSLVQADIETYLTSQLEPIHPLVTQIQQLVEQSGTLFIFAATVVRYIGLDDPYLNHRRRFDAMLGLLPNTSSKAYTPLDTLYSAILSTSLGTDRLEDWEKADIELVLHTVVCAKEPLSVETLTLLLQLASLDHTRQAIEPLRSVLHIDAHSGLVSTLHASFPDYLLTSARSGRFFCDRVKHNRLLAERCFGMMKDMLRFNICSLESSSTLDHQLSDLPIRISGSIPAHLFYACRYWSDHLLLGETSSELLLMMQQFLCQQVLYWVEVMNLKRATGAGIGMLAQTYSWMKAARMSDDLCLTCQDAQKLITIVGGNCIRESTPHIYVSILALWNKTDPMWLHYGTRMQKVVRAIGGAIDNRESAGLAVWQYKDTVLSVSVSPDGSLVASGSAADNSVCIWDAHTGRIVTGPLTGHTNYVNSVSFSPDGAHVASGSSDKTIRIWDVKTGQPVAGPLEGHTEYIRSVAFSPDGNYLASGSDDQTVCIWDAKLGRGMIRQCHGHDETVWCVAYSPDGCFIVSGSWDHSIRVWDAKSGDLQLGPIAEHTGEVQSVAYSPDGRYIVSGSSDRTIQAWDSHSGNLIAGPFEGHTDVVRSVAYSPDGAHIVSSSYDHTIRLWDAQTGKTVAGPLRGHTNHVYAAVYMPDGNRIVSCSSDRTIRIWDARTRHTRSNLSDGHTAGVMSVAFSPDGNRIVSGSEDCMVCIWDAQTGRRLVGPLKGHNNYVRSVAFSPSGDRVASASGDQTIRVWDAQSGRMTADPMKGHDGEIYALAFSPDGCHLASGSEDCTVRVWDAQSGSMMMGPFRGHTSWVFSVAYSPDGGRIVSCSRDCSIRVWDAQSGAMLAGPFEGHTKEVNSVSYSPDGCHILSGSDDHTIRIWDAETGHSVLGPLAGHTDFVWSTMYSPDSRYIVSGSFDQTTRIWDAETGDALTGPFRAHAHRVTSVTFSPDSQLIASCSLDSTIRVWDTQKCLATPHNSSYWTVNEDGWVVDRDSSLLFWVPADLRPMLKWPQNTVLINQQGSFELDFTDAALGPRWTECWKSE